jgi:hypothetical protein
MTGLPVGPDDALFSAPATDPGPARPAAPEWTRVHSAALRCDRCSRERAEAHGQGPRPALARWRHRLPGVDELLCYPHAQELRDGAR